MFQKISLFVSFELRAPYWGLSEMLKREKISNQRAGSRIEPNIIATQKRKQMPPDACDDKQRRKIK